jgi:hypothetical protein
VSRVIISDKFDLIRGGHAEMGYLENVCKVCNWHGQKHYAHNDYQHTNCREERTSHKCVTASNEGGK